MLARQPQHRRVETIIPVPSRVQIVRQRPAQMILRIVMSGIQVYKPDGIGMK